MTDIVRVKWLDHSSFPDASWKDKEEVIDLAPLLVDSVGFLVSDAKEYVVIAAHVTESDLMTGELCILRSCIKSMKVIRRGVK